MKEKEGRTDIEMKEREVEKIKGGRERERLVRVEGEDLSHHPWKTQGIDS